MRSMNNFILSLVFLCGLTSCESLTPGTIDALEPIIVVSVLQVIEQSDTIGPEDVIAVVDTIKGRANLDGQITSIEIMNVVNSAIDLSRLTPTENYIITTLILRIESTLSESGLVNAELSSTVKRLLDTVEMAARLAGNSAQ